MTTSTLIFAFASLVAICTAFAPIQNQKPTSGAKNLFAKKPSVPKFDGEKWVYTSPDQEPSAGYGIAKTLILHGPQPFFNRVFQPDDYEQAVLKFMAGDKCSREEAQGNMDFYLANPNDWAYNRFEMEKKGVKYDYVTLKPKALGLTLTWSTLVLALGGNLAYSLSTGQDFWAFLKLLK